MGASAVYHIRYTARGGSELVVKTSCVELQRKIGEAVARARKRDRLTQQGLARIMKTRQANISRIERGLQNLSLDLLVRLENILGINLSITVK